jgi:hypothetical protein
LGQRQATHPDLRTTGAERTFAQQALGFGLFHFFSKFFLEGLTSVGGLLQ